MTFSQIRQYIKGVLSNIFNKILSNIAPKFNPTETYAIGDRVIYNGDLYQFTSAHTGAWAAADASKTNVNAYLNNNSMVACGGGYAPIGTVIAYMGTRAPSDFLICDGTVYNIADYTELADFFEAQFGSSNFFGGDGNTTFAVPDLRGEFLRGTGTNSHANQGSGANVGVHQDGTGHLYMGYQNGHLSLRITPDLTARVTYADKAYETATHYSDAINPSTGLLVSNETYRYTSRPTNTSVLYCIKAKSQGNGYSLDEQIVGTWIDGKPIYQKVVSVPSTSTVWGTIYTVENADYLNVIQARYYYGTSGTEWIKMSMANGNDVLIIATNGNNVVMNGRGFTFGANNPVEMIIQYTKTTD